MSIICRHMSRYVPSATISYSNQTLLLLCDISLTDELTRMGPPCCKLPRWAPCSSAGPEMNDYQKAKTDRFMAKACKSISFFSVYFKSNPWFYVQKSQRVRPHVQFRLNLILQWGITGPQFCGCSI